MTTHVIPREALELYRFAENSTERPHLGHIQIQGGARIRAVACSATIFGMYEWDDPTLSSALNGKAIWLKSESVKLILKHAAKAGSALLKDTALEAQGMTVSDAAKLPDTAFPDIGKTIAEYPQAKVAPEFLVDLSLLDKVYAYTKAFKGYDAAVKMHAPEDPNAPILFSWYESKFLVLPVRL